MPLGLCCVQRRRNVSWPPFLHINCGATTTTNALHSKRHYSIQGRPFVRLGGEERRASQVEMPCLLDASPTRGWEEKGDKWEERIFARVLALAPFAALKLNPEESRFPVLRQRFTLGLESMKVCQKKTPAGFTEFTGNEAIDVCCTLRRGGVRTRT